MYNTPLSEWNQAQLILWLRLNLSDNQKYLITEQLPVVANCILDIPHQLDNKHILNLGVLEGVKYIRKITGWGLKEAKDYYDKVVKFGR